MPTARELAQDLSDERSFLARFPAPALVFDAPGEDPSESRFDTPPQPFLTHRGVTPPDPDGAGTEAFLGAIELTATGLASDALQAAARIEWLAKTERNPFGAMVTLGRSLNNDVIVVDPRVSKVHAIFTRGERGWDVSDSHSSNGTFLDGLRLPSGEKRSLDDGAELRFGREVRARFVTPQSLFELLRMYVRRRPLGS
jgi:hypothetical protein